MTLCNTSAQALQELIDETVSALAARWQEETQAHFPEHQHLQRQISTRGRTKFIAVQVDAEDGTFSDEQLSKLASQLLKQEQTKQSCPQPPPPPPPVRPANAIKSSASKQKQAEECLPKKKQGKASEPKKPASVASPARHVKDPTRPVGAAPPKAKAAQHARPPRAAQHRAAPPKAGQRRYVPIKGSAGGNHKASEQCGAASASNAKFQGVPYTPPPSSLASERKASATSASSRTPPDSPDWKEQSARGWEADECPSSTAEAWTHPSTSWDWEECWDETASGTWDCSSTDYSGTNEWYKPDEVDWWPEEMEPEPPMSEEEMWENYYAWEREQQEKHRESGLERNQWIERSQQQKRIQAGWHEDEQPRKNLKQRFNKHMLVLTGCSCSTGLGHCQSLPIRFCESLILN